LGEETSPSLWISVLAVLTGKTLVKNEDELLSEKDDLLGKNRNVIGHPVAVLAISCLHTSSLCKNNITFFEFLQLPYALNNNLSFVF